MKGSYSTVWYVDFHENKPTFTQQNGESRKGTNSNSIQKPPDYLPHVLTVRPCMCIEMGRVPPEIGTGSIKNRIAVSRGLL